MIKQIISAAQSLQIELDSLQAKKLVDYVDLISHFNQGTNLTAIKHKQAMYSYHIYDSLSIIPYLQGDSLADMGTGAGLPGVVIAIAKPSLEIKLFEANNKKATFLKIVARRLQLENVQIKQMRVEDYQGSQKFAMVSARALANFDKLLTLAKPLLQNDGILLSMQGANLQLGDMSADDPALKIYQLHVPGLDQQRQLVCWQKN